MGKYTFAKAGNSSNPQLMAQENSETERKLTIDELRAEFGYKKEIPTKYEKEILIALSHYPELKNVRINFKLSKHASVPYGTKPSTSSYLKKREKRVYIITLLE